jgi:hypothetical protein
MNQLNALSNRVEYYAMEGSFSVWSLHITQQMKRASSCSDDSAPPCKSTRGVDVNRSNWDVPNERGYPKSLPWEHVDERVVS